MYKGVPDSSFWFIVTKRIKNVSKHKKNGATAPHSAPLVKGEPLNLLALHSFGKRTTGYAHGIRLSTLLTGDVGTIEEGHIIFLEHE